MQHAPGPRRTILPDEIAFTGASAPPRHELRCPACGESGAAPHVLSVPRLEPPHTVLDLYRCGSCESLVFDPPGATDIAEIDQVGDDAWRHYVESGGDVWETVWPAVVARGQGSLLDVGCGFGFGVDFWSRSARGEATGVESAMYGRLGAGMIGAPIVHERLDTSPRFAGRTFDIVLASEVIEHTEDPRAFAALLARHVADDGILALTTPDAACVDPSTAPAVVLAALSPGFHGFVMSQRALEGAVRGAGFAHLRRESINGRQFLWASRRAFDLAPDREALRLEILDYLARRGREPALDASVRIGFLYRLLRDLVRLRRYPEADAALRDLDAAIVSRHGASALDPDATIPRLRACRTAQEAGAIGSYCLPRRHHLAAQVAQHARGQYAEARRLYRAAAEATEACALFGAAWYMEAIASLWSMRIDGALLGLALGDERDADELALAADEGTTPRREHAFATVDPGYLDRLLPNVVEDLVRRGAWTAARKVAGAYHRHLERRYGPGFAETPSIEAALSDPAADVPPEPLFVPWFRALSEMGSGGDAALGREMVRDVLRVAEAHASDPRCGRALETLARRARRRLGAMPRRP
jgi:SAM-dependent methyltransferase